MMKTLDLSKIEYSSFLDKLFREADMVGFVIRQPMDIAENCRAFLSWTERNVVRVEDTQEWPGTQLLGSKKAKVFFCKADQDLWKIFLKFSGSLQDWLEPNLPEDLFFQISDGITIFASITHEDDFYFPNFEQLKDRQYFNNVVDTN